MIRIDADSTVPPFEQVRSQIAGGAADGTLPAGTKLPPVRKLADDLGLAVNTVARAYRELEAAGVVETRGRGGTFVTAQGDSARLRLLEEARRFATVAHDLGIDREEAISIVTAAFG